MGIGGLHQGIAGCADCGSGLFHSHPRFSRYIFGIHRRYASAASMIDDNHWWVTGGFGDDSAVTTNEIYVGEDVDLPVDL